MITDAHSATDGSTDVHCRLVVAGEAIWNQTMGRMGATEAHVYREPDVEAQQEQNNPWSSSNRTRRTRSWEENDYHTVFTTRQLDICKETEEDRLQIYNERFGYEKIGARERPTLHSASWKLMSAVPLLIWLKKK